jgi:hypothetical protein
MRQPTRPQATRSPRATVGSGPQRPRARKRASPAASELRHTRQNCCLDAQQLVVLSRCVERDAVTTNTKQAGLDQPAFVSHREVSAAMTVSSVSPTRCEHDMIEL